MTSCGDVCMGLDLRLCTYQHLVKKESALVKDAIVEAYVVYGMNVFEYEHSENQRILENQTDEAVVQQAQGDNCKKCRRGGATDNAIGCVLRSAR